MNKEFEELMKDTLEGLGKQLKSSTVEELGLFMEERAMHLASIVGEPGYAEAVAAERDAVAMKAGIVASRAGDLADQRLLGVISGALRMAVVAL